VTAPRFCVCIPARDEAERLPVLLDALAAQDIVGPVPVALCINNSSDESLSVAAQRQARWAGRLDMVITSHDLPPADAHAGMARRLAMDAGLARVDPVNGVLISTDADTRPPPDWIGNALRAVDCGLDMVGGRIVLDEEERVAADVVAMRTKLDRYWSCVRAIEEEIDPCPWDPAPRHGDHTGASLAITAALYRAAGGVPILPSGEDRALVENAIAAGGRLGHPMSVWTRASARTSGRAAGGMAEYMRDLEDRLIRNEPTLLPSLDQWRTRAEWRRMARQVQVGERVPDERDLPPMICDMPLALDR
jgi:GT2 family glycosyltransferase